MPKRRRDDIAPNSHELATLRAPVQNAQKRRKTVVTVEEVQRLLSRYDGASSFDDIPDNPVLRRLFGSLRSRFRPETTRSERNVAALKKIDVSAIELPEPVRQNWSKWRENRWSFWGTHTFQRDRFDHEAAAKNVKNFVESSWDLGDKKASLQVLWRFNSVALFLTFWRWKPDWRPSSKLTTALIGNFLREFTCEHSDAAIQKTLSIIRSGQRRLAFCKELSGFTGDSEALDWKRKCLGLLFLDFIPDSRYQDQSAVMVQAFTNDISFDDARGLRKEDISCCTQFLRSHRIPTWLETSGVGDTAIFLLELPVYHIWLERVSDKDPSAHDIQPPLYGMNSLVAAAEIANGHEDAPYPQDHLTSADFTSNCTVQDLTLAAPAFPLPTATMPMTPNTARNINDFDENWQVPETAMRMDELWGQDDDWGLMFRPNVFS